MSEGYDGAVDWAGYPSGKPAGGGTPVGGFAGTVDWCGYPCGMLLPAPPVSVSYSGGGLLINWPLARNLPKEQKVDENRLRKIQQDQIIALILLMDD